MKPNLWKLVRKGNSTVATHACLAAVKHSAFGDPSRSQWRIVIVSVPFDIAMKNKMREYVVKSKESAQGFLGSILVGLSPCPLGFSGLF